MTRVRTIAQYAFVTLCITSVIDAKNCNTTPTPYFFTRSQSRNKVLQVAGQTGHVYLPDSDGNYTTGSITVAYERSFKPSRIASCIFGNFPARSECTDDDCSRISFQIQGSQVDGKSDNSWLADYFYLQPSFSSIISFKPRISNTLIFLDKYIGLDDCLCGLYLRFYGPVVHARWNLDFCETNIDTGDLNYRPGYFSSTIGQVNSDSYYNGFIPNIFLHNFGEYAAGLTPVKAVDNFLGLKYNPLWFAKINKYSKARTGFADLRMELGWNFLLTDCYYLGVNAQAAAPTGNAPDAEFLFNPVIGNGNHWELGGGVIAGYSWIMDEAQERVLSINLDANLTHLFRARQQRTFDLKGKENSRYMLAMRMEPPVVDLTTGTDDIGTPPFTVPNAQFKGEYMPVANLTTADVKVSIGLQADVVVWLNYIRCNWSFDLGYNFWGTTCEKIKIDNCTDCKNPFSIFNVDQQNRWVLKGNARVFGFASLQLGGLRAINVNAVPLSASQSQATIYNGTNPVTAGNPAATDPYNQNEGVDNPRFAYTDALTPLNVEQGISEQVQTSLNPIFIQPCDVDITSHQGLTHKVFGHISYTWADRECLIPYLGAGWSAEFDQCKNADCPNPTSLSGCCNPCDTDGSCLRCAPSLWSVWIKGGISWD